MGLGCFSNLTVYHGAEIAETCKLSKSVKTQFGKSSKVIKNVKKKKFLFSSKIWVIHILDLF